MTTTTAGQDVRPDYRLELALTIRERMFRQQLRQPALAYAMGCSKQSVSGKLTGRVGITTEELFGVAGLLGTTPADLLEEVGQRVVRRQGLEPRTRCFGDFASDLRVYAPLRLVTSLWECPCGWWGLDEEDVCDDCGRGRSDAVVVDLAAWRTERAA